MVVISQVCEMKQMRQPGSTPTQHNQLNYLLVCVQWEPLQLKVIKIKVAFIYSFYSCKCVLSSTHCFGKCIQECRRQTTQYSYSFNFFICKFTFFFFPLVFYTRPIQTIVFKSYAFLPVVVL